MSKSLFAAAAAAAAVGLVFAAQAQAEGLANGDANTPPSQAVVAGHVDFRDTAAVDAFYVKLARTAGQVCDSNSANARIAQADRACAQQALAVAVRKLNRPLLTARYERSAPKGSVNAYARGY